MSLKKLFGMFGLLGVSVTSHAQVDLQSYQLLNLTFQYRSNVDDSSKCLLWQPLEETKPTLMYDIDGNPYMDVVISARMLPDCKLKISNPAIMKKTGKEGYIQDFEVRVTPPLTSVKVRGPNFVDELVFEAPVKKLETISFFDNFKKARFYAETRYVQLKTNNPDAVVGTESTNLAPVFGGYLGVPLPFLDSISLGISMFQNLGNLASSDAESKVRMSEFAGDIRYTWTGSEESGRPQFAIIGDIRGRTIYQTGDTRSYVSSSTVNPGFGFDGSWYFGTYSGPNTPFLARLGLEASTRFYLFTKIEDQSYRSMTYEGNLSYRFNKKWALGLGYSTTSQKIDFTSDGGEVVNEPIKFFYLRLSLVPFLGDLQ